MGKEPDKTKDTVMCVVCGNEIRNVQYAIDGHLQDDHGWTWCDQCETYKPPAHRIHRKGEHLLSPIQRDEGSRSSGKDRGTRPAKVPKISHRDTVTDPDSATPPGQDATGQEQTESSPGPLKTENVPDRPWFYKKGERKGKKPGEPTISGDQRVAHPAVDPDHKEIIADFPLPNEKPPKRKYTRRSSLPGPSEKPHATVEPMVEKAVSDELPPLSVTAETPPPSPGPHPGEIVVEESEIMDSPVEMPKVPTKRFKIVYSKRWGRGYRYFGKDAETISELIACLMEILRVETPIEMLVTDHAVPYDFPPKILSNTIPRVWF